MVFIGNLKKTEKRKSAPECLGAIWRSEEQLEEFDMRARGARTEGKSSWVRVNLEQVSKQPYCTEIISPPLNRNEFKIICNIRKVQ